MDDCDRAQRMTALLEALARHGEVYYRVYGPTIVWTCGRIVTVTPEGDYRWNTGVHSGDDPENAARLLLELRELADLAPAGSA